MLSNIRSSDSYYDLKENVANTLYKLPGGDHIVERIKKTKSNLKQIYFQDKCLNVWEYLILARLMDMILRSLLRCFMLLNELTVQLSSML